MKYYVGKFDPIQLIIKVNGKLCNMDCAYCYEQVREYETTQAISVNILESTLRLFEGRPLSVQLHGGEPLMCDIKLMRDILICLKKYPNELTVNIQTNGTLLDDKWLDLFDEVFPSIEIGISSDGDKLSNVYRRDKKGNSTVDMVEKALSICSKRNRSVGIIAVVNRASLNRQKAILEYFSSYPAIKVVNFMPCFDLKVVDGFECGDYLITLDEYNKFILTLFRIWIDEGYYKQFFIEPLYSAMSACLGKSSTLCHYNEFKCAHIFTLYPDGTLSSCDEVSSHYSPYGNVKTIKSFDDIVLMQKKHPLMRDLYELNRKCSECKIVNICHEGCMSTRRNFALSEQEESYCQQKIELLDYFSQLLGDVMRQG